MGIVAGCGEAAGGTAPAHVDGRDPIVADVADIDVDVAGYEIAPGSGLKFANVLDAAHMRLEPVAGQACANRGTNEPCRHSSCAPNTPVALLATLSGFALM